MDLLSIDTSERFKIPQTDVGNIAIVHTDQEKPLVLKIREHRFPVWKLAVKRMFDLLNISVIGIILFPVLCLIAVLIKLDSRGPVFYVQKRMGKGGKHFFMYKFRSMFADADIMREELAVHNEADGYLFKIKNDKRITKMGKILRKLSLDELPQIFNVLKGEMSLVGPRPLPASDLVKMSNESEYKHWLKERCKVPPGITGLWQVNGRNSVQFDKFVGYDMDYLENWSLRLDLRILLKTVPVVVSRKGAY